MKTKTNGKIKEVLCLEYYGFEKINKILKSNISIEYGCWVWTGTKFASGYARLYLEPRQSIRVHRMSFLIFNGPLIPGLVIDHKCRNKICINPNHLRQVSNSVNSIENSNSVSAINIAKTHCKNGHEFTEENTYNQPNTNFRYCKKCSRIRALNWYNKKK